MTHASVFSGIGGPEVAASMLGWENLFHCEINPFGRAVLDYWFPNSKSYEDITKTDFSEWRGRVNVLTGGFPCQPFSYAGQRRGAEDDRYLWPFMHRCINQVKPDWVVCENVAGITTMVEQGEVSFRGNRYFDSPGQRDIIHQAAEWCIDHRKMGLMLCGIPGNGKTTLMNAINRVFGLFNFKNAYGEDVYMRSVSAIDVANTAKTNYERYKKMCYEPMLAIDDFGEEPAEVLEYGNVLSPITELLSIRYKEQFLTVLTTNTAANKIRERYGARIADRFNEMMKVIIFTNPSYRGKQ